MKNLLAVTAALILMVGLAFGQATTTSTTAAAAIAAGDTDIYVASATGISAPARKVSVGTILAVDRELLSVRTVSGTRITVLRGQNGTLVTTHASGATIWIGAYNYFGSADPVAGTPCTATAQIALPLVVPVTGHIWQCVSSLWVSTSGQPGTAASGVSVSEYGTTAHRTSKLSFSGLTIGAAVGAANLAFGKLLYTLPAGAVVLRAAQLNVALAGSGSTCDADTPDVGIGTVIGSGAVAVLGGTATFENLLTGQTAADVNGTATVKTVSIDTGLVIETAGAHTIHLNVADGWAGACTVTATGTITLDYLLLP